MSLSPKAKRFYIDRSDSIRVKSFSQSLDNVMTHTRR